MYSDSDIYKWTEAVGFALQSGDRPELRATADKNDRRGGRGRRNRAAISTPTTWTIASRSACLRRTQTTGHELYCIGHMLQGAIAYYRATGDRKLLDAGIRFVDDFLMPELRARRRKQADRLRTS